MTRPNSAVGPTVRQRWRTGRWVVLTLLIIAVVAGITTYLTASRPGGRMDAESTSPEGARALVTMLRDAGVDVVVAGTIADVEDAAGPGTLIVLAQTFYLGDEEQLLRLDDLPGDRLLVEPVSRTREALAPELEPGDVSAFGGDPNCDLAEANRAGEVQLGLSDTFQAADDGISLTSCYDGAVVRYRDDADRSVTVVGTADFMANGGLLKQGNAALAMNLAGTQPRVIWFAPQRFTDETSGEARLSELMPDQVTWIVLQLSLVVALLAVWKGRRVGPLVAEQLPVVVRASETVEGRGRLYRSRRARDRAADALRTAVLHRLVPRLGLGADADPSTVIEAVAARAGHDPAAVGHALFGPAPTTDADLVNLAHQLDNIERQVAQS